MFYRVRQSTLPPTDMQGIEIQHFNKIDYNFVLFYPYLIPKLKIQSFGFYE